MQGIDPDKVKQVHARETQKFLQKNPKSLALYKRTQEIIPNVVPNYWINYYPHPHPIFFKEGIGAYIVDVDGNDRLDFCLGGSACLFGYGEPGVVDAVAHQMAHGSSPLLATEDAYYVGIGLKRVFGLPYWQVYVSATEANRNAIRISRMLTGREKIVVYNGGYLGAVEDSFAVLENGHVGLEHGVNPNARDINRMTRVVEFNDIDGIGKALADEQVACVIGEPAISNSGIVLPRPGFHQALRDITRKTGTLLVVDETQCIGAGYGGFWRQIQASAVDADVRVQALAPTSSAAAELGKKARIPSQTVMNLIVSSGRKLGTRDLLVVDEAGQFSNRQALRLLELSRDTGARILFLGDNQQTGAIEQGKAFWLLQKLGLPKAELTETVRQQNEKMMKRSCPKAWCSFLPPSISASG